VTISIKGKEHKLGLALSGGGYRAAAFHLGVIRKLDDLGLLEKTDVMSCVSGGAIVGAYICQNWKDKTAIGRLEVFLENESLFSESILASILTPTKSRTETLATALDEKLFRGATLDDLSNGPRIFINATNVGTGNLFTFSAGGGSCTIGEYELGYARKPDFSVAMAVTASCAYPFGYAPLILSSAQYALPKEYKYTALIDGGVYDNLGVGPLLLRDADLDFVILSDAGFPYQYETEPTASGLLVVKNAIDIMMGQNRRLQFGKLMSGWKNGIGPRPIWFSIDSEKGEELSGDAQAASTIATGLTKLDRNQIALLERQGASLVQARIERHAPELLGG